MAGSLSNSSIAGSLWLRLRSSRWRTLGWGARTAWAGVFSFPLARPLFTLGGEGGGAESSLESVLEEAESDEAVDVQSDSGVTRSSWADLGVTMPLSSLSSSLVRLEEVVAELDREVEVDLDLAAGRARRPYCSRRGRAGGSLVLLRRDSVADRPRGREGEDSRVRMSSEGQCRCARETEGSSACPPSGHCISRLRGR